VQLIKNDCSLVKKIFGYLAAAAKIKPVKKVYERNNQDSINHKRENYQG
jgi:hypothetical protein